MKTIIAGLGVLIMLAGAIFTLQGFGVIGGSAMSGVTFWAVARPGNSGGWGGHNCRQPARRPVKFPNNPAGGASDSRCRGSAGTPRTLDCPRCCGWPVIGYDKAAAISYYAIDHNQTLKQATPANGVSEELYDRVIDPLALTRRGPADAAPGPRNP